MKISYLIGTDIGNYPHLHKGVQMYMVRSKKANIMPLLLKK